MVIVLYDGCLPVLCCTVITVLHSTLGQPSVHATRSPPAHKWRWRCCEAWAGCRHRADASVRIGLAQAATTLAIPVVLLAHFPAGALGAWATDRFPDATFFPVLSGLL